MDEIELPKLMEIIGFQCYTIGAAFGLAAGIVGVSSGEFSYLSQVFGVTTSAFIGAGIALHKLKDRST
jgi:hypothetical protein